MPLVSIPNFSMLAAAPVNPLAGALYGWAPVANTYGQLGNGTTDPGGYQRIGSDSDWVDVMSVVTCCIGLKSDGSLLSWGQASNLLGTGSGVMQTSPTPISGLQVASMDDLTIVPGSTSIFAISKQDQSIFAWGGTSADMAAVPTNKGWGTGWKSVRAVLSGANGYNIFCLHSDGSLWVMGSSNYNGSAGIVGFTSSTSLVRIGTDNDWDSIYTNGNYGQFAIKQDGSLWAWGYNNYGQLGNNGLANIATPTLIDAGPWKIISAVPASSFGLKQDGTLWSWGGNAQGQLGQGGAVGSTVSKLVPTQVGTSTYTSVRASFNVNYTTMVALRSDGALMGTGYTQDYTLGLGTAVQQSTPARIGGTKTFKQHSVICGSRGEFALDTANNLWGWKTTDYLASNLSVPTTMALTVKNICRSNAGGSHFLII